MSKPVQHTVPTRGPVTQQQTEQRADFRFIADMVRADSKIIDVGCGDGALMEMLQLQRNVTGCGIELDRDGVRACVAKGLSVVQGDADSVLEEFPDQVFDYAILSRTLQTTQRPQYVLEQLVRIARRAIVSFQNFGYWRVRGQLFWQGRMPISSDLPYEWYETPNVHFCTIKDFRALCDKMGIQIDSAVALGGGGHVVPCLENLLGDQAVFSISR